MQLSDLKTPGMISNAIKLRNEAFRALGYAGNMADMTNKTSDCAANLAAFFEDCAAKARAMAATAEKGKK